MENKQVGVYLERGSARTIKEHEQTCIRLIKDKFDVNSPFSVLDVGCAHGAFLDCFSRDFQNAFGLGIDINPTLLGLARDRQLEKFEFRQVDMFEFPTLGKFDLIIASGILSIFDDLVPACRWFVDNLSENGTLVLFSRINEKNIDVKSHYRLVGPDVDTPTYEAGMNAFSKFTIKKTLAVFGLSAEFIDFELTIDLPETGDPVRSFTMREASGKRLVVNGANLIADQKFVVARRSI